MMDREEFERIKQAEKEHLRALKKIKAKLHEAQRTQKLRQAIQNIEGAGTSDTYDEMLDKLERETIEQEVRLDVALEGREDLPPPEPELDEATLRAQKAAALVRQMRIAMGASDPETEAEDPVEGPEKTIGRMKTEPEEEAPAPPRPEKTIGRARRASVPDPEDDTPAS